VLKGDRDMLAESIVIIVVMSIVTVFLILVMPFIFYPDIIEDSLKERISEMSVPTQLLLYYNDQMQGVWDRNTR
jgi:hypothetical protein